MELNRRLKFISPRKAFRPAYLALFESGELKTRVENAITRLTECSLCPHECRVDRCGNQKGDCNTGRFVRVSSFAPHFGEENPLRGTRGSGTIFLTECNLHCVFCQNYDISHQGWGTEKSAEELAWMMVSLQRQGCHNINWVTPDHVVPQLLEALYLAVDQGLKIPIVYNTSAFVSESTLSLLDGIVDIYMPDFKIWSAVQSAKFLLTAEYPETARKAIKEMHRQVGDLVVDEDGIALRGVLLRHLVMPENIAESSWIMTWVAEEVSKDTYINIMGQYRPSGRVNQINFSEINRRINSSEMLDVCESAREAGLWRFDLR